MCIGRGRRGNGDYFFLFCVPEEIYHVVRDDEVILGLIVNCVFLRYD